jgi:integrase
MKSQGKNRFEITRKAIDELELPTGDKARNTSGGDWRCPWLRIECRYTGKKSFVLVYKEAGKGRRDVVGDCREMSISDALAKARARCHEIKERWRIAHLAVTAGKPTTGDNMTLSHLIAYYEAEKLGEKTLFSKNTLIGYRSSLNVYIKPSPLINMPIKDITQADIQDLYEDIANDQGRRQSGRNAVKMLSGMFTIACQKRWAAANPAKGVVMQPIIARERFLNKDELEAFFEQLREHDSRDMADALWLLIYTGAREMEVCGAEWSEFDYDMQQWVKPAGRVKGKRTHYLPIRPQVISKLREIKRRQDRSRFAGSKFVFPARGPTSKSGHMSSGGIYAALRQICLRAGINEHATVHDLRRTAAVQFLGAEGSMEELSLVLQHKSLVTTQKHYGHMMEKTKLSASTRLADIMSAFDNPKKHGNDPTRVVEVDFNVKKVSHE